MKSGGLSKIGLALLAIGLSAAGFIAVRQWTLVRRSPEAVALAYARAVYARDYARAWQFLASEDQQIKTRDAYLAENTSFTDFAQELAYKLAGWIAFTAIETDIDGDRATVSTHVVVPNGNQREVFDLLQTAKSESDLTADQRRGLAERLEALHATGTLEFLEGDQVFQLVREPGGWRLRMGWADAILIKLTAEVSSGLDWEFYPLRTEVLALPGETLTARYRVVNRSERSITAKAKHFVRPEPYQDHFVTIQCFCFLEQTLAPGESQDLSLIFRIDYGVPPAVREFENHYVFYPIESFPDN